MGKSEDNRSYIVRGNWDPLARGFKELTHLNEETPKGIIVVVVFYDSVQIVRWLQAVFFRFFLLFPLGARVFLTIALDLVISGIHEPVRFLIEAKARVCVSNSKGDILSQDISDTIWSSFKKSSPFTEEFDMILREVRE